MDTKEKLLKLIDNVFDGEIDTSNVNGETLISDLGINSIGYLYLAVAIEEEFSKKFTNEDFANIKTVNDAVNFIEDKK